jgi:hypothetical protein
VFLIDGNAQPMDEDGIARYVREQNIGLVGIGVMPLMIAKAYRMADAVRAAGVPVVMGGAHMTEMADEALGRKDGMRHADGAALGGADQTWPNDRRGAVRNCGASGLSSRAGDNGLRDDYHENSPSDS